MLRGVSVPLRNEPKIPEVARAAFAVCALAACVVGACALAGCGRKATEADCSFILDRNVEVQMRQMNIVDPVAVAKRKDDIRGEMKDSLKDCVGKRVTDSMMGCVQRATSADEIDKCMR